MKSISGIYARPEEKTVIHNRIFVSKLEHMGTVSGGILYLPENVELIITVEPLYCPYPIRTQGSVYINGKGINLIYVGSATDFISIPSMIGYGIYIHDINIINGSGSDKNLFNIASSTIEGVLSLKDTTCVSWSIGYLTLLQLVVFENIAFVGMYKGIQMESVFATVLKEIVFITSTNQSTDFFKFLGTYYPYTSISLDKIVFNMQSNEYGINLNSSMLPSCMVNNCDRSLATTQPLFNPISQTEKSQYVYVASCKNIKPSLITIQVQTSTQTSTTSPIDDSYKLANLSNLTISLNERMSSDSSGVLTYTGLEETVIKMTALTSLECSLGTNVLISLCLFKFYGEQSCSFDGDTDYITCVGHGFENGDTIIFYDTGSTIPSALNKTSIYYVRNKTTDTFQVSYLPASAIIDFANDDVGSNSLKTIECLNIISDVFEINKAKSVINFSSASVLNGYKLGVAFASSSSASNVLCNSCVISV